MSLDNKLREAVDAHAKGRIEDAERLYKDVLQKRPRDPVALHYVGVIYLQRNELDAAISSIRKSIAINNKSSEAYGNLGLALASQGKLDEAVAAYHQSLRLAPTNAESYCNMAGALIELRRIEEAIDACRKALEIRPDSHLAHYNLGVSLQRQGRVAEAAESFRQALRIMPNLPEAHCNLGLALVSLGKPDEAIAAYQRAIELRPNFPEAYNNIGQPLSDQRRLEEATMAFRRALEYRPGFVDALNNLVTTLRRRGMLAEALEICERGLEVNPNNPKGRIEVVNLRRHVCAWHNFAADMQYIMDHAEEVEPFIMLNAPSTPAQQLASARKWSSKLTRGTPFSHAAPRKDGRIRVGYLSADYRQHATAYLVAELFERHDHSRFEWFAYSYGYDDGSEERKRMAKSFDHFVDFRLTPSEAAAQKIYEDKIDILVDLKGYTGDTRTDIIVNRPAPIQVNFLGYPGTMGADFVDYIVADPFVAPLEHQPFYSEKIVQMPHCYQPNDTKRPITQRLFPRSLFGLPEQGFVFCCFNGSYKITPVFFDIWMRLLKAVPGSVLWLLQTNNLAEANLRREAAVKGVDPARLVFSEGLALHDHLARHRLADLFLDTLPINAHTTASDALWAGLPLLTCAGDIFVGRVAGSLLKAVGLPELIATSPAEYEAKALELTANPQKLAQIKEKLAQNRLQMPLFDIGSYTRSLERAYIRMADIRSAGLAPQTIVVSAE
jgi:predicted O-linked N-acetylglucosamine transferase (SPINDLY family)